jgi:hypothetical protein
MFNGSFTRNYYWPQARFSKILELLVEKIEFFFLNSLRLANPETAAADLLRLRSSDHPRADRGARNLLRLLAAVGKVNGRRLNLGSV